MPSEPKSAPQDDKRSALLAAASELFLKNSYANISIRKIADKAKVNSAMIAYYFGSKSGLFREMMRHFAHTQMNLMVDSLQHASKMSLAEFLNHFYQTIPPELAQLMVRTLLFERGEMRNWLIREILAPALDRLERVAAEVIDEHDADVDPLVLRTCLQVMMIGPKLMQPVLQEVNPERVNAQFFTQLADFNADLIASYFKLENQ